MTTHGGDTGGADVVPANRRLEDGRAPASLRQGESFLLAGLVRDWERLTGEPARRFRLMKASSRPGHNLPILFFLFVEGEPRPAYALKVNRNPDYPDAIEREYRNYSAIYARVGGDPAIPRPLFCAPIGDRRVLCETVVAGRRCEDRYFSVRRGWRRRRAIERFLERAMAWAGEFHRRTRVASPVIDAGIVEDEFERPLVAFAARPDVGGPLAERLHAFTARLPRLAGMRWPVTAVHGDFDHGNILLEGDRVGVVDWEDCRGEGNPFVDLAFLVFDLALVSDLDAGREQRLRSFFAPSSWSFDLLVRLLREYARSHDLDPDLFWLALPRTVIDVLTHDYGPERDLRSIPLHSLAMLDFALALAERETDGRRR